MGIRERQHNVPSSEKTETNRSFFFKVQDLFFSRVNIVKQISISPPLPVWHFQLFSQQFALLSLTLLLHFPPSSRLLPQSFLTFPFHSHALCESVEPSCIRHYRHTVPAQEDDCQLAMSVSSGATGRKTPSLMAGSSNLLGRREDISLWCFFCPCSAEIATAGIRQN